MGVECGRGDDDLQIRPPGQNSLQVAKQEIDVETAFVHLVDDQGVITTQQAVIVQFPEQDAVGHDFHVSGFCSLVTEPNLRRRDSGLRTTELAIQTGRDTACRKSARLGLTDVRTSAPSQLQADFRNLGRFSRPCCPSNYTHLVLVDELGESLPALNDGQILRGTDDRQPTDTSLPESNGVLDALGQRLQLAVGAGEVVCIPMTTQFSKPIAKLYLVAVHGEWHATGQLVEDFGAHVSTAKCGLSHTAASHSFDSGLSAGADYLSFAQGLRALETQDVES